MAEIVIQPGVLADFDRILEEHESAAVRTRIGAIFMALEVLTTSPLIGRPAEKSLRELVISRGAAGYIALYRYDPADDTVIVLKLRARR